MATASAARVPSSGSGDAAEPAEPPEVEDVPCDVPLEPCIAGPYSSRAACGVYREEFGNIRDPDTEEEVAASLFTLTRRRRFVVRITDYGAAVVGIHTADRDGVVNDIAFGFDNAESYEQHVGLKLGAIVGRVAGRIPWARYVIGDAVYNLTENVETDGACRHHEDGGLCGLQRLLWNAHVPCEGSSLVLSVVTHHEEDGYPGAVLIQVRYSLTTDCCLLVDARAETTIPTPIGLRQGIMFNLAGHGCGQRELLDHVLTINADEYAMTTRRGTHTGETHSVKKTPLDFRTPRRLRKQHDWVGNGYQHTLCLVATPPGGLNMVARLEHPESGRVLEIRSDQPCVHLYTGRHLPEPPPPPPKPPTPPPPAEDDLAASQSHLDAERSISKASSPSKVQESIVSVSEDQEEAHKEVGEDEMEVEEEEEEEENNAVVGKDGVRYGRFCGIWLAPEWFPNAIDMTRFPKNVLVPGQTYSHTTLYRFYTTRRPARQMLAEQVLDNAFWEALLAAEAHQEEAQEPPPEE